MGKSAKLHKRVSKKAKSSATTLNGAAQATATQGQQVQTAKKRANLKHKASKNAGDKASGQGVLGGADYVSLLMGGRRKAQQEAQKLPQDDT